MACFQTTCESNHFYLRIYYEDTAYLFEYENFFPRMMNKLAGVFD
jgi:hypothetical protein